MQKKKYIPITISLTFLSLFGSILIQKAFAGAWKDAPATPPNYGTIQGEREIDFKPVTLGDDVQYKTGPFGVGTRGIDTTYGLTIGTTTPNGIKVNGESFFENGDLLLDQTPSSAVKSNICFIDTVSNTRDCISSWSDTTDTDWTISGQDLIAGVTGNVTIGGSPSGPASLIIEADANNTGNETTAHPSIIFYQDARLASANIGFVNDNDFQIKNNIGGSFLTLNESGDAYIQPNNSKNFYVGTTTIPIGVMDVSGDIKSSGSICNSTTCLVRTNNLAQTLSLDSCSAGQIAKFDGTSWICAADSQGSETDTLQTVTDRGSSTTNQISISTTNGHLKLFESDGIDPQDMTLLERNAGKFNIYQWDNSAGSWIRVLSADMAGNVGLGIAVPNDKLEVAGTIRADRFRDRNNTSYYVDPSGTSLLNRLNIRGSGYAPFNVNVNSNNTAGISLHYPGVVAWQLGRIGNSSFSIAKTGGASSDTMGTNMFTITAAGNVGIGTTSPDDTLEVAGTIRADRFRDRNDTSYYVSPGGMSVLNSVRARVFYDKDNTNYYVNPYGTSKLRYINIGNTTRSSWPSSAFYNGTAQLRAYNNYRLVDFNLGSMGQLGEVTESSGVIKTSSPSSSGYKIYLWVYRIDSCSKPVDVKITYENGLLIRELTDKTSNFLMKATAVNSIFGFGGIKVWYKKSSPGSCEPLLQFNIEVDVL